MKQGEGQRTPWTELGSQGPGGQTGPGVLRNDIINHRMAALTPVYVGGGAVCVGALEQL